MIQIQIIYKFKIRNFHESKTLAAVESAPTDFWLVLGLRGVVQSFEKFRVEIWFRSTQAEFATPHALRFSQLVFSIDNPL